MKSRVFWSGLWTSALGFLALLLLGVPAVQAQVRPGDFITAENAEKVKNLVSPGVYYKVVNGMTMKIIPAGRIEWPPPYREATEKYSSQVRLSADHRSIVGYVAGQPFPLLDPNDPQVAQKLSWNMAFRPILTDDYDQRFYDCETVYTDKTHKGPPDIKEYFIVGHYAGYSLVGRNEVDPMPTDPDFKQTGRYWLMALYPVLAPAEIRGVGFIRYRYADPFRGDDSWAWIPGSRRIRRLNDATMTSSLAPGTSVHAWDPDHYSGFNAKIEEYNYKFLGEKEMLASDHAERSPEIACPTDGGASVCPEVWEMRHMYVLEAAPRLDRIHSPRDSKTVVFLDSEAWTVPYVDKYDWKGRLFNNVIYWMTYRDRPVPDAKVAIYPFKRQFEVGAVATDISSGLATPCYRPGVETPERETWYINMGAVEKEFFTTQALTKSAH
jgi:hypothetical protein